MNEKPPVPAIKVRGLTKTFDARFALRGVDLEIAPRESVVLFGPNGAGKTTLIKILSTIMNPTSGEVTVDGLSLKNNAEDVRRKIGVVTHYTFLYGNLTGAENLDFYARLYDVPRRRERIQEVAEAVGMASRMNDRVATLSRGMQQRLSIARAVLHDPTIMLLDEPETGLDQEALPMLWRVLPGQTGKKRTVILTTHNLERGLNLCDRVLILDKGKIVYEGARGALNLEALKETYQQRTMVKA